MKERKQSREVRFLGTKFSDPLVTLLAGKIKRKDTDVAASEGNTKEKDIKKQLLLLSRTKENYLFASGTISGDRPTFARSRARARSSSNSRALFFHVQ